MDAEMPFINQLAETATAARPHLSISIGIYQNGQAKTHHFGQTHPPKDKNLYEIGSLTKVFTAILLAKLVQNGTVALGDSVSDLLDLPNFPKAITLRSLSTHHSGLPRLPRNIWWSILKNPANPYLNYRTTDLHKCLNRFKSTKRIGKFEYSNLAVGLLGHILETTTQTPYAQLIQQHITQPLAMADTTIQLSPDQQQRLIPGYVSTRKSSKPTPNWDLPAIPGCGALRSTIPDLLKFATANLNAEAESSNPLAVAMAFCQQSQRSIQSDRKPDADLSNNMAIGLGWFIRPLPDSEIKLRWHDGGTGGYQSSFALHLPSQTAVIVLANCPPVPLGKGFSATATGDEIFNNLLSK